MLIKPELDRLFRYAWSLTKDQDQAFDLLQIALEKMIKNDCDKIENKIAYLMRTIRNDFIDEERRNRKFRSLGDDEESLPRLYEIDNELGLDDILIHQQDVTELLSKLNPCESELLYLWAVEEYTIDEIAELQNVARGTLLSRLHRMKKRIKAELKDRNSVACIQ